jgi:hypothetical protein
MKLLVATHGHCFDGLASAALFTRLVAEVRGETPDVTYRACGYGVGQARPDDAMLCGEENGILDYSYHASELLGWYFDHHRTAFASDDERAHFEARRTGGRLFYVGASSSCT